jgi:hypothetical protein
MKNNHTQVVGYFAVRRGTAHVVCDGDACVIAGSQKEMNRYIFALARKNPIDFDVKKTRYGEILQGLHMGGVYTFDKRAYQRFYPIAKADGLRVVAFHIEDNPKPNDTAIPLMRVKWIEVR